MQRYSWLAARAAMPDNDPAQSSYTIDDPSTVASDRPAARFAFCRAPIVASPRPGDGARPTSADSLQARHRKRSARMKFESSVVRDVAVRLLPRRAVGDSVQPFRARPRLQHHARLRGRHDLLPEADLSQSGSRTVAESTRDLHLDSRAASGCRGSTASSRDGVRRNLRRRYNWSLHRSTALTRSCRYSGSTHLESGFRHASRPVPAPESVPAVRGIHHGWQRLVPPTRVPRATPAGVRPTRSISMSHRRRA